MDEDTSVGGQTEPYLVQSLTIIPDELAGNTFLGLCRDRVDMVATLRGKQPEFYLDYVGATPPTPATIDRLLKESMEAMKVPMKALADNMPVQDLVCAGMALQGQSHNFLVIANGKIQAIDEELDALRVQKSKF